MCVAGGESKYSETMLNKSSERINNFPVDLLRVLAIVMVILFHAAGEPRLVIDVMSPEEILRWWASNVYLSLASPCIALFVLLSGFLLLQPSKVNEPLMVFFRKRWVRIGLPFIFWALVYFLWRFLLKGETFTWGAVLQGVLMGPYVHFWFLYLLLGLFLITPVFRVLAAYSNWKTLKYFMVLWLAGTAITYLFFLFAPFCLNADVFLLWGWAGYYFVGVYLMKVRLRRLILYLMVILGYLWTVLGTYLVVGNIGERFSKYFYDSFSVNVIAVSMALFLIFSQISPQNIASRFPRANRLIRLISLNTLPIYLFHMIVLETLQKGYLGFKISITTLNPIVEIPFITAVALFICLGVLIPLKKIPYIGRVVG